MLWFLLLSWNVIGLLDLIGAINVSFAAPYGPIPEVGFNELAVRSILILNTLCRGSALRYLLTRSYDYLNTPKQAIIKIKDPKEYIDKLNFHRNISSFKDYS